MSLLAQYAHNLLVVLDEALNALTGGDPGETVSSRAAKAQLAGRTWGCVLCRFLGLFNKDHCAKALDPTDGSRAVIPDGE